MEVVTIALFLLTGPAVGRAVGRSLLTAPSRYVFWVPAIGSCVMLAGVSSGSVWLTLLGALVFALGEFYAQTRALPDPTAGWAPWVMRAAARIGVRISGSEPGLGRHRRPEPE